MSDLTALRDHCRKQAKRADLWEPARLALWLQMADEIDAYLAAPPEDADLFGAGVEPAGGSE